MTGEPEDIHRSSGLPPLVIRREFFWSARTLRANLFDADGDIVGVQDVLHVDRLGCIVPNPAYGDLIVRLLQKHFDEIAQLLQPDIGGAGKEGDA